MSEHRHDGLDTIADCVDALTNPMHIRERIDLWDDNRNRKIHWHQHCMPSLIVQLSRAAMPGEVFAEDEGGVAHRAPASCPPARLEAINLGLAITAWAADTAWFRCGIVSRETTTANLRALVGAKVDSDTTADILSQLRRWVNHARVVAGWQRPPWRPDVPCPACERKGLRVRLDLKTAICVECAETWDEDNIGLLAQHVAQSTARPLDNSTR